MSEILKTLLAKAIGLPPPSISTSLRPPLDAQNNRLWDVWVGKRHLIAKEFLKPAEYQDAPVREYRALKLLSPMDIAPQPVLFLPHAEPVGPIVVYEFMEGEMWDRYRPTAVELGQLAEVWLEMNAVPKADLWMSRGYERPFDEVETRFRNAFRAYGAWASEKFPPGRRVAELCLVLLNSRHAVTRELAEHDPPLCFCRSDPRLANVIRRPDGRLGLVDWEDSGLRDPARDLADIVLHANQEDLLSPDEWEAFLQPYIGVRGISDPNLVHRTRLYMALFPIFWLAVLMRDGLRRVGTERLAGWEVNGLPANQRLRRYLARGLAWPEMDLKERIEELADLEFFPGTSKVPAPPD